MNVGTHGKQPLFLATTALEEFWDTSKPIIFLGDWCLRYSRRAIWEQLQGEVVQKQWPEKGKLIEVYRHVNDVYEKVLTQLSQALNDVHGIHHSIRYWRIVIGPWLFHYIHILYDRYMSLRHVLDYYPEITTYGLAEINFVVPQNTMDFIQLVLDDPFNLQVYTKILVALGKDIPRKNIQLTARQTVSPKNSTKRLLLHKLSKLFHNNHKIILSDPYFDRFLELEIIARTLGKVWSHIQTMTDVLLIPVNTQTRMILHGYLPRDDEFMEVLKSTLPMDMPQSYLESFKHINHEVRTTYPVAPEAIFSAVSWYFDEPFKQWAAFSAEKGTKLMGIQHGGNYGSSLFMAVEDHELAITDRFYSWGWDRSDCYSKVVAMPAPKLSARKSLGKCNKKKGILFVGTGKPRYFYRFQHFLNYQMADYLQWQLRFINSLSTDKRDVLRFRPHQKDYGWDMRLRWEEVFPKLPMEGWQVPFMKSLENSRLYVGDHLSTTFTEALASNNPTILFWDSTVNELREEAKPYYDALQSTGILYHSPEDAAAAVNTVYDTIESWWNEPSRQDARQYFCDRFAKVSDHPVKEWVSEFRRTIDAFK